jgi:hypothetical protein
MYDRQQVRHKLFLSYMGMGVPGGTLSGNVSKS